MRLLTAPGAGGVALIQVAGPAAGRLLRAAWRPRRPGAFPAPGRVALGTLCAEGEVLDEVLLSCAESGRYELGCHAGPALVARVLEAFERGGARRDSPQAPAQLDALQAEAWAALPAATTPRGARVLLAQLDGALSRAVRAAQADPSHVQRLLATCRSGRALLEPLRVALVGRPNAGKSSLLNALLDRERALVAPQAGTTRDAVVERCALEGYPVELVDTAGQRATPDPLEAAGVERARLASGQAQARVVVLDATDLGQADLAFAHDARAPRVVVLNKRDLLDDAALRRALELAGSLEPSPVSARSGEGLVELGQALLQALGVDPGLDVAGAVAFTLRQQAWLERAAAAWTQADPAGVDAALDALATGAPGPDQLASRDA